jgi:hypothetical protein
MNIMVRNRRFQDSGGLLLFNRPPQWEGAELLVLNKSAGLAVLAETPGKLAEIKDITRAKAARIGQEGKASQLLANFDPELIKGKDSGIAKA